MCKVVNCNNVIDTTSNKFFCLDHLATFIEENNVKCRAICALGKNKGKQCPYNRTNGIFCNHHCIKIKTPDDDVKLSYGSCRRYKLKKVTPEKRRILKQWFGVARKYYNETLSEIRENKMKSFLDLRPIVEDKLKVLDYCTRVPLKIRQEAIHDAHKAYSNAFLKYADDKLKANEEQSVNFSRFKFRSKKDLSQSININKDALKLKNDEKMVSIYTTMFGEMNCREEMKIFTHCRLVMVCKKVFYLCSPQVLPSFENQECSGKIVSIDPGVRNFASFYSETSCGKIGMDTIERLKPLQINVDCIKKKLSNKRTSTQRRRLLRKHWLQLNGRCTHLVKELHHKTALFLCKNFEVINLPLYRTKQLQRKGSKWLNRWNTMLSHYKFKQILIHTSKQRNNKIVEVSECYTTKSCTRCGNENKPGRDIFNCKKCMLHIDRDYQGSRNIHIKSYLQNI